jgi:hypothetical protein
MVNDKARWTAVSGKESAQKDVPEKSREQSGEKRRSFILGKAMFSWSISNAIFQEYSGFWLLELIPPEPFRTNM